MDQPGQPLSADRLFRLDGRVALVTGAARGLGQAIAVGLASAGADVALLDREDLSETAARVRAYGRRSHTLSFDLLNLTPAAASKIVAESVEALEGLQILVNNAGLIRRASALDYPAADWQEVLQVDLTSAFYLSQAAAQQFVSAGRGGKILQLCSMLSFQGGFQTAAYTAAKSGLAGLTRALANEWAPHGINVNALAPGYFTTEVTAGLRADPARAAAVLSRIPAGRWGDPSDLVGAAIFLTSDASSYIHGAILPVDGGWLAW